MEKGSLPHADPHLAAMHLKGMLEAGMVYPLLYGAQPELETSQAVTAAVRVFLKAYG
jgi:hypothetical protein